jgi:hypothetical protein
VSGQLRTNNNTYLATSSGQSVGIGTTSATYTLDVSGQLRTNNNTYLATSSGQSVGIGTTGPSYTLDVNGNLRTNNNTYLATSSGQSVGIGTTGPAYTLDVSGQLRTTKSTYLATSSGQSVGIGTTSPAYTLDVSGTANMNYLHITSYRIPDYDSGWIAVTKNDVYPITHNLNWNISYPPTIRAFYSTVSNPTLGTNSIYELSLTSMSGLHSDSSNYVYGINQIRHTSSIAFNLSTATDGVFYTSGGEDTSQADSGYYRIFMYR